MKFRDGKGALVHGSGGFLEEVREAVPPLKIRENRWLSLFKL